MADQNFRVKRGLEVGLGATVLTALPSGFVGIGTTNPTAKLDVVAGAGAGAVNARVAAPDNHIFRLARIAPAANPGNLDFQVTTFGAGQITADNSLTFQSGTSTPIVFNTSGANERVRIDSSGNLGIGTNSLGAQLHINPTSTNIAGLFSGTTSSDMIRITQLGTGNALRVEDSANPDSSPFVITGSGDVGIGTINPSSKLAVEGAITVTNPDASALAVRSGSATSYTDISIGRISGESRISVPASSGQFINDSSAGDLTVRSNATSKILFTNGVTNSTLAIAGNNVLVGTVSSTGTASQPLQVSGGAYISGNLGIGTTNPTVALQLSPNASISNVGTGITLPGTVGSALTVAQFYYGNANASYLRIKATRNEAGSNWFSASTKLVNVTDVTEQGYIEYNPSGAIYGMAFGSGSTEWARFLQGGNLGIGTTNPLDKLHVLGDFLVAAGSSTGQHITQKAYELNNGTMSWEGSAGQLFSITNNLTSGSIFSVNDVSGIPSIDVNANGTIALAPYGTTENVGVGTTSPTSKLTVEGNALITGILTARTGLGGDAFESYEIDLLGYTSYNLRTVASTITFTQDNNTTTDPRLWGTTVNLPIEDNDFTEDSTYVPYLDGEVLSITNPFRLMITVNGVLQSAFINNTDNVYQSNFLGSRNGYTIDSDNNIKFTESVPTGSEIVARVLPASSTATIIKNYPFKPTDIVLGY